MINMVRGRRSFCCRLGAEVNLVAFDSGGERFYMVMEEKVWVHEVVDARLVWKLDSQKRVLRAVPSESGLLYTGGEDRNVAAWDTKSGKIAYQIEDTQCIRVKGLVVLGSSNDTSGDDPNLIASASSDGAIRVWHICMSVKERQNHWLSFAQNLGLLVWPEHLLNLSNGKKLEKRFQMRTRVHLENHKLLITT